MQLDDPLLAIAIRDGSSSSQDMLVAAESGIVRLMDGDRMITKQEWQAHDNAIFDLKWRPGHDQCLTSSGDTSFSLWDMDRVRSGSMPHDGNAPILTQKSAHMSSIKSISFMDENVLASASRDGCIHVWDIRCNQRAGTIADAHLLPHMRSSSSSGRKKNSSSNPITGRSNPVAAVTAVLFHPHTNKLFSAGASDASIKLWDLRMLKRNSSAKKTAKGKSCKQPQQQSCVQVLHAGGASSRHGFSSLAFDKYYNIYASCSDHAIYSFDPRTSRMLSTFSGNLYRTDVFTKITILDDFLISGSVAASAPIWFISDADRIDPCYRMHVKPRYVLPHDDEVTVVDVHRLSMNIFALSDDVKINKWNLFQKLDQKIDPASGQTHLKAVKYEEKDVDIEEMLPRIREMGGRSDRQPNTPSTPTIAASSASASVITTPKSGQSRGTPLTTLKDWLTVTNSNSPSESLIQQSSSSKKRPHIVAKENSQAKKLKTGGKISSKSRPV